MRCGRGIYVKARTHSGIIADDSAGQFARRAQQASSRGQQTAITIPPDLGARYRQDLPYGTPAWHARYATLRNTIEGLNGLVKDPAHEALAAPARRRVRGIAACTLFTALLLTAANTRKIRAWRALTASNKAATAQRARRRRASLRDYLPDG